MNCETALLLIIRALENDLNSFEEVLLEDHLANCPHCVKEAQEIMDNQAYIENYFKDFRPLSPDFTEKVMAQVRKQPKRFFWNSPLLKVASVAILLGGISIFAYAFSHNGGPEMLAKKPDVQLTKLADQKEGKQGENFAPDSGQTVEQKHISPVANKAQQEELANTVKKIVPEKPVSLKSPEPPKKTDQQVKQEEHQEYAALRAQPEATSAPDQIRALGIAPEARESVQDNGNLSRPRVGYLPSGYHLAHHSEEKDSQGRVKAIHLYYLPEDEQLKPSNGLPWNKYLSVALEEGTAAGEKDNSIFTSPQGEKEIQRSLDIGEQKLKIVIKSKGIREWELIRILDSIEL